MTKLYLSYIFSHCPYFLAYSSTEPRNFLSDKTLTVSFVIFPHNSVGKEYACNAGDLGSIPGLGRCPGQGKGYPLQYSGLENSMDIYSPWGLKRVGHN